LIAASLALGCLCLSRSDLILALPCTFPSETCPCVFLLSLPLVGDRRKEKGGEKERGEACVFRVVHVQLAMQLLHTIRAWMCLLPCVGFFLPAMSLSPAGGWMDGSSTD